MTLRRLNPKIVSSSAKKMMDFLESRIVGQNRALQYLKNAAERANSPLRNKNKPIGSFLFLGPSGVGKTETARALARYLFGDSKRHTYIDCTKFTEPHTVSELIGSPPGYIGFIEPGEDQESSYPLLSHWNVYKHHHLHLKELHEKEMDALYEEVMQLDDLREEMKKLVEKINAVSKKAEVSRRAILSLKHEADKLEHKKNPSPTDKQELNDLKAQLAIAEKALKQETEIIEILRAELNHRDKEYSERKNKNYEAFREACAKGWEYDADNPPKDLIAVVIFDEIEKAAVQLHDVLMEIVDTGTFRCGNGEITHFNNAFVIMTSNVGQQAISELLNENSQIGFRKNQKALDAKELDKRIYDISTAEIKNYFRPEFINRFDKVVIYRPLSEKSLQEILNIRISDLLDDLKREGFGVNLKFDFEVKKYLVAKAMKRPEEGARLLEKRLTDYIRDRLVALANTKQIKAGDTIVIKLAEEGSDEEFDFYIEEN